MTNQTIAQALKSCASSLANHKGKLSFNEPSLEAKILLGYALNKSFTQLYLDAETIVSIEQQAKIIQLIERRLQGEPIAYITGSQAFWTLELEVSTHTLIPRSDTETLVEAALALPIHDQAKVVDLGTGTGAVALALASERPGWQVVGVDFKAEIVDLANRNAQRNKLSVHFLMSDWFQSLDGQTFDLIVSNPPYVELDSAYLRQGDLRFEPLSALTSPDEGLADIKKIIRDGKHYLNSGGFLGLEHGHTQANSISNLFASYGYTNISTVQDINGLDRVTLAAFGTP